jgi:hypothetical protein
MFLGQQLDIATMQSYLQQLMLATHGWFACFGAFESALGHTSQTMK